MSESKFETISALVDNYQAVASTNRDESLNEFVTEHTIDEMHKDKALSSAWHRYHLIGDVIRDEIPQAMPLDLSENIAKAIAQEPAILSPGLNTKTINTSESKGIVLSFTARTKKKIIAAAKPLGQVAIAASAAGLMILGVQQNAVNGDPTAVVPSQIVQTMPVTGFANPVSFNFESTTQKTNRELQKQEEMKQKIAQQRRFQALLLDHHQQLKFASVVNQQDQPQVNKLENASK